MKRKVKTRFPLLPYRALAKHWLTPATLLIPAGVALWWAAPQLPLPDPRLAPIALIISVIGTFIASYALLARRAHISCHPNKFVIHTPLYPVSFSYKRIEMVRSIEFRTMFPPEDEKRSRWNLYKGIWGKTVIVIMLKSYPMPIGWIRLWFHPYLLHPSEKALVLPVEDWMALSRQLEIRQTEWRERRKQR